MAATISLWFMLRLDNGHSATCWEYHGSQKSGNIISISADIYASMGRISNGKSTKISHYHYGEKIIIFLLAMHFFSLLILHKTICLFI